MHTEPQSAFLKAGLRVLAEQDSDNTFNLAEQFRIVALAEQDDQVGALLAAARGHENEAKLKRALNNLADREAATIDDRRMRAVLMTLPLVIESPVPVRGLPAGAARDIAAAMSQNGLLKPGETVLYQRWLSTAKGLHMNPARRKRLLLGMLAEATGTPGADRYRDSLPIDLPEPGTHNRIRYLTFVILTERGVSALEQSWARHDKRGALLAWLQAIQSHLNMQNCRLLTAQPPCIYAEAPLKGQLAMAQETIRTFCVRAAMASPQSKPDGQVHVEAGPAEHAGQVNLVMQHRRADAQTHEERLILDTALEPKEITSLTLQVLGFITAYSARTGFTNVSVDPALMSNIENGQRDS